MDDTTVTVTVSTAQELMTALTSEMATIQGDVLSGMAKAAPYALGIAGAVMTVFLVWRFFRGIAH